RASSGRIMQRETAKTKLRDPDYFARSGRRGIRTPALGRSCGRTLRHGDCWSVRVRIAPIALLLLSTFAFACSDDAPSRKHNEHDAGLDATSLDGALWPDAGSGASIFYVSTEGNDAWSGHFADPQGGSDGPFRTPERAFQELEKAHPEGVTLRIRSGTYFLT